MAMDINKVTIHVRYFNRKPTPGGYSLERVYGDIRSCLSQDFEIDSWDSPYYSQGIFRRIFNSLAAAFNAASVNHVTGDVHYLAYFLPKKRCILTVADSLMLDSNSGLSYWILWLFWFWLPEKRCEYIVVISDAAKRRLLSHLRCDPNKIKLIYCNVSDDFQPVRRKFRNSRPRLLQIGTTPNKNIERLASALKGLDCMISIIGELSKNQENALRESNIDYVNRHSLTRTEIMREYVNCDLVVFVSTYEGFGLPIVEANAVGRPVVASNLSSMPEVAGCAACFVNPFDESSIRDGILKVINNEGYREQLVERGYDNVKRFRTDVIANQYAALYRNIGHQSGAVR